MKTETLNEYQIMSIYQELTIQDVGEIYDGPHATPRKTPDGPIFLGISNLINGRIDLSNAEHLSEKDFTVWTRRVMPQAGDIVFSYETRLGEAAIIPAGLRCCLGRRMGLIRVTNAMVNPRYLLYYLLSLEFQSTIKARTVHGSTVDRIPLTEFPSFPIRLPDLETQNSIAIALGSLDDKIDLNRRMNQTLEEMARAIFKSWFVDFDPVRAKAEGRDPGLPAEIADLFPDSFEVSPLGKIPKGWRVDKIGNICDFNYGSPLKGNQRISGNIPVFGSNGQIGWHNKALIDGPGIIIGRKGNPGSVTWSQVDCFPIDTTFYVVAKNNSPISQLFLYFILSHVNLPSLKSDTAVPGLNRNIAYMSNITIPPDGIVIKFSRLFQPMFSQIHNNNETSCSIERLKGVLMPRLFNCSTY